jgi:tetratricopeptide (TPR) repeat protein
VGEIKDLYREITEIYWMEAKHHPTRRSIGKYTLDTHLVSAFFSRNVKRLHVVTSGKLSANFILRANTFGKEHGFIFAYSDVEAIQSWLAFRKDIIRKYFDLEAAEVFNFLKTNCTSGSTLLARASVYADNDAISPSSIPVSQLLPGRRFRLVVSVSLAKALNKSEIPLRIKWDVPPEQASLLVRCGSGNGIFNFDPFHDSVISIPFRLLGFSRDKLPNPVISASDGTEIASPRLDRIENLPRLASPFVGEGVRDELFRLQRVLSDEVSIGNPSLIICRGRAGSGKSRFADEMRDSAQVLGFEVKSIEMPGTLISQEEHWRQLFRCFCGLEYNPFNLSEEEIINRHLKWLDTGLESKEDFVRSLSAFLLKGVFSEDLFSFDLSFGVLFAEIIRESIKRQFESPVLIHIDDAHLLSRRQLRPLYFLRHLIETSNSLPLCVLLTARNDETVRDNSFDHFSKAFEWTNSKKFYKTDIPEMSLLDARELVALTLRWPELLAKESKTLEIILERAGTNPFLLIQMLNHLTMDNGAISFGHGTKNFLIDVPAFKLALRKLPKNVQDILSQRFEGLIRRGEHNLLAILATIAVVGRQAPRRLISQALEKPLFRKDVTRLLELNYLDDASGTYLELSHDLLADALKQRPEIKKAAHRLAKLISSDKRMAITKEQQAAIYYEAGQKYYRDSWALTRQIVEGRAKRQEYLSLPPLFDRMETIAASSKSLVFDSDLAWISAVAEQHCGNTHVALRKLLEIMTGAEAHLTTSGELYINALIEIGNQHILRAEATHAIQRISQAIEILDNPAFRLRGNLRAKLQAVAHNRFGAVLHLVDRKEEALKHFNLALAKSVEGHNEYLYSHTCWNLAALLRFSEPRLSASFLRKAYKTWETKLRHKERLRLLVDCSMAYSECIEQNNIVTRSALLAVAAEASEKGYLFQASSVMMALSSSLLEAEKWDEAKIVLLKALDLTLITEDMKNRTFATHYLSICAHMTGMEEDCLDWCWQACRVLTDPIFTGTDLGRCLLYNEQIVKEQRPTNFPPSLRMAGRLKWYRFNRA